MERTGVMPACKYTDQLALLSRIAEAVIASEDLQTVSQLVVDLAVEFMDAQGGALLLVDNRNELIILGFRGEARASALSWRGRVGQGVAGVLVSAGRPILCHDLAFDERFNLLEADPVATRTFASSPIVGKERILGSLVLNDSRKQRRFSAEDLALLQAISAQMAMALEKILLAREYQQRSADIEEANRRLIEQDIAKTEFLTRVSHELRNPLHAIKGAVHLLQGGEGNWLERRREFEGIVASETERLLEMVNRQLDFLRIEDESRVLRQTFFSFESVLRDVLHIGTDQMRFAYRQLDVELDLVPELGDIVGDKILVGQMIRHLMDGLAAYLKQTAKLRITIQKNSVINLLLQGFEAVPEEVQDGLLAVKNIYQADRPEESVKFYLAMKVAEGHGWRLGLGNSDEGFRVSLQIPRADHLRRETALNMIMDRALGFVSELLGVDTCSLMLSDELTGDLTIRSARGLDEWVVQQTRIRPGDRIAGWVVQEGKPVLIDNIETDRRFYRKNADGQYRSKSLLSLPLFQSGRSIGVINLNNKRNGEIFSRDDLALATAVCERVALLVDKASQHSVIEGDLKKLLLGLDKLLLAENRYGKKNVRYAELMMSLMRQLGASEAEAGLSRYVSLIYDLGLMPIEDKLATNKGTLSPVELKAVRIHPEATLGMLSELEFSEQVIEAILHHHERFDGTGYPKGLKGKAIPLMARALAVVDAYCAMTEPRPYRQALGEADALLELQNGAGRLYDPQVVEAFGRAIAV